MHLWHRTFCSATPRDRIGFNLGYTHAEFRNADKQVIPGAGGRSFADLIANSSIPRSVPGSAQLLYDRSVALSAGSALTFRGVLRYKDAYDTAPMSALQAALGAEDYVRADAAMVGDLNASWTSPNNRFSVTAYVRTVSDKVSKEYVLINDSPTGGLPR